MAQVAPLFINLTTGSIGQIGGGDVILPALIPWDVPGAIGSTTPAAGTFTNLTSTGNTVIGNASGDTLTVHPNAVTWSNNPTHSGNHSFSGEVFFADIVTLNANVIVNNDLGFNGSGFILSFNVNEFQVLADQMTFTTNPGGVISLATQSVSMANDVAVGGELYIASSLLNDGTSTFNGDANHNAPCQFQTTALFLDGARLFNGASPSATADTVWMYSSDDAAGHTIPSFYCEGTNVVATGQADSASSVRVKMRINGTVRTFLCI